MEFSKLFVPSTKCSPQHENETWTNVQWGGVFHHKKENMYISTEREQRGTVPASSRILTACRCPFSAAMCSAVCPSSVAALMSALCSSNMSKMSSKSSCLSSDVVTVRLLLYSLCASQMTLFLQNS